MKITPFNKAIAAGVALLFNTFVAVMGDNVIDMTEKQHFISVFFSVAVGVYAVYRAPKNAEPTPPADSEESPDA